MLISESRFRKIINEELKKLMKEAAPPPAQATAATQDPKLESQAKITRQGKVGVLDLFFNNAAKFLTKYRGASAPNAELLRKNWATVKANPDPPPGAKTEWLYGDSITAIVTANVDLKNPTVSLFKVLCAMSGNGGDEIKNLDVKGLFKRFSGKEMIGPDNKATPEATEFTNTVLPQGRKAAGVIADLYTFLMPETALQATAAAKSAAGTPATAPTAAGAVAPGAAPAGGFTYTVKQGDSITKILQQYYKFNPALWAKLPAADVARIAQMFGTNNPDAIVPRRQVALLPTLVLGGATYKLQATQPTTQPVPTTPAVPAVKQPIVNRP